MRLQQFVATLVSILVLGVGASAFDSPAHARGGKKEAGSEMPASMSQQFQWEDKVVGPKEGLNKDKVAATRERGLRVLLAARRDRARLERRLSTRVALAVPVIARVGEDRREVILSRISIRHELAEGTIVEVALRGRQMKRDFYEVFHSRRPLHPIAQVFLEFLKLQ
jgi:hypothetical protein